MTTQYNLKNIRVLLTEGFTDEELRRFCYDMPEFRPVYDQLAQASGKAEIIDRLIEHADRKLQVETLLALAKEHNPSRYEEYRPYHVVTSLTTSNDVVEQPQAVEDPMIRFERLSAECYEAFTKLKRELILLAGIIVDAWFEFSQEDEDGDVNIYSPFSSPAVREEVADYIIEKLLVDPRADHHTDIETIRSAPSALKRVLAKQILHFDREVFLSQEQPWFLVWHSGVSFQKNRRVSIFARVFNEIIPSQFVSAMTEFAVQWTSDVEYEHHDLFFEYLVSKYRIKQVAESRKKDCQNAWQRWSCDNKSFKILVFYERVGILTSHVFFDGVRSVEKSDPLITSAAIYAFRKHKPFRGVL